MKSRRKQARSAAALLLVVIILSLLAVLLAVIAVQISTNRRTQARRLQRVQASWLARSGVELALQKWLNDPEGYKGEILAIMADSEVKIVVAREKDEITVNIEARYPADPSHAVVRTAGGRWRHIMDGNKSRLEHVAGSERGASAP